MKTKEQQAAEKYPYLPTGSNFTVENTHDDLILIKRAEFIAGYEAAQRWIKYSEQKPEIGQLVIVYRDIEIDRCYITNWSNSDEAYASWNEVTHWLPIPELPTI